jgi:hypothetical protein
MDIGTRFCGNGTRIMEQSKISGRGWKIEKTNLEVKGS